MVKYYNLVEMIGKSFVVALLLNDAAAKRLHRRDMKHLAQVENIDFRQPADFVSVHTDLQQDSIQNEYLAAKKEQEIAQNMKAKAEEQMKVAERSMQDAEMHLAHV